MDGLQPNSEETTLAEVRGTASVETYKFPKLGDVTAGGNLAPSTLSQNRPYAVLP